MDKQPRPKLFESEEQAKAFGYTFNALRDTLGTPEGLRELIEAYRKHFGTTKIENKEAAAKFTTDFIMARAEAAKERDAACKKEPSEG